MSDPITIIPPTTQRITVEPNNNGANVAINVVAGVPGPRGINVQVTVSATPPSDPQLYDMWIDIS